MYKKINLIIMKLLESVLVPCNLAKHKLAYSKHTFSQTHFLPLLPPPHRQRRLHSSLLPTRPTRHSAQWPHGIPGGDPPPSWASGFGRSSFPPRRVSRGTASAVPALSHPASGSVGSEDHRATGRKSDVSCPASTKMSPSPWQKKPGSSLLSFDEP